MLGGFAVEFDGRTVAHSDWQRVSAERLVKLLLVTPGHRVSREVAAETLWPEADPEASRGNLRKAIHFAHRALAGSDLLGVDGSAVALDAAVLDLDLDRLQAAFDIVAAADEGPAPGRVAAGDTVRESPGGTTAAGLGAAIDSVLRLGRRPLLPDDAYEDWLAAPRERLQRRWQAVALKAAAAAAREGRTAEAHEIVGRLLDQDPADEAAHRLVIGLLAAEGRHHAARRQFEMCRRALRELLDAEPSAETQAALVAAEGALAGRPAAAAARLLGRQAELERIESLLDRVARGHFAGLVIGGPAGIGKTRLLQEVIGYARAAGWWTLEWQASQSARPLAYAPLRIGLAGRLGAEEVAGLGEPATSALATVLPGLGLVPALPFEERPALTAALASALERLTRRRPVCLALDDLPWLDAPSLEVLGLVLAGVDAPLLLAVTFRDDEAVAAGVRALADQVRARGGLELGLGPLAARDIESLVVSHLGGESLQPELVRLLHQQSQGNPLFCLELARTARAEGTVRLEAGRWSLVGAAAGLALPDSVRRLVAARSTVLPKGARELLEAAAELGPTIRFETLARALELPADRLLDALDAALGSGLLVERDAGYAFAHPLYRLAVHGSASGARRARLHLRIAGALAALDAAPGATPAELERAAAASSDPAAVAEQALAAAELGSMDALPLAVAYGFAAGEREVRVFDAAAGRSFLERSLAAWRRLPAPLAARFAVSGALTRLAAILVQAGDDTAGAALLREAVERARDAEELSAAYREAWLLPYRHGDFETAMTLMEEALARLPPEASVAQARIRGAIGWCLVRMRRLDEAFEPIAAAATVLDASPDRRAASKALDDMGMLLGYLGRWGDSTSWLERALAAALEGRDVRGELVARLHLAVSVVRAGRPAAARPLYARVRELARLIGDRYFQALERWGAAEMEDAIGEYGAATVARREELALLASMGGNPHNEAMSHAHLAHLAGKLGDTAAFDAEAAAARDLAQRSAEAGYEERIERALSVEDWADMVT